VKHSDLSIFVANFCTKKYNDPLLLYTMTIDGVFWIIKHINIDYYTVQHKIKS